MKKLLLIIGMMMFVGGGVSPVFGEAEPGDRRCTLGCPDGFYACVGGCSYTYSGACTTMTCANGTPKTCCAGSGGTE